VVESAIPRAFGFNRSWMAVVAAAGRAAHDAGSARIAPTISS